MMQSAKPTVVRALVVAVLLAAAGSALAFHRTTPNILDVTSFPGGTSVEPFVQGGAGRYTAFQSSSDLLHNGSTGFEIFLFDLQPPRSITQVTNFGGNSLHGSTDANGNVVAFDSDADIFHSGSSARQVYLWNRNFKSYTQVTHGNADSTFPKVSADAGAIVFESNADILQNGIPGPNIYLWTPKIRCDPDGCGNFRQLTKAAGNSGGARFSEDPSGNFVLFHSDAPLLGSSNGFQQLFIYDRNLKVLTQVTAGNGDSIFPTMDSSSQFIAFQSQAPAPRGGRSSSSIARPGSSTRSRTPGATAPIPRFRPAPRSSRSCRPRICSTPARRASTSSSMTCAARSPTR